jgi:RNA polymerase sigma factor (sigma-70 family)
MTNFGHDRKGWAGILRRIGRFCGPPDEAEDLLQSAFAKMEEYRAVVDVRNPAAFLVRTAGNLRVDERRKRWRETSAGSAEEYCQIADKTPLQDEVLVSRERLVRVLMGLDRMPSRTRQIFLLRRVEGLKYREIAEQLGISQSAVEKHVARAAQFLAAWTEGW